MSKIVIADSTCLIGLSKIGQLHILRQLFEKILIPSAVFHEVVVLGAGRYGAKEVENAEWIEIREVENQLAVQAFRLTLGAGESEAIVLAQECAADFHP
jgi:predicted nucleic acid-binding protein